MSRPIDEKIVKMTLDNKDFQSNAEKTVGIFGKLKNAFSGVKDVNLDKSTKSIKDINQAADRTTMSSLIGAVDNVSSRFSAMGIIAMTALQNITNKAVDAGMRMAKAFTTDSIRDGFQEYELKMGSIQTIMSNTMGKNTLAEVGDVLDDLNTYADKTIYNFGEMTRNIGTFTAAGVDLETSATAIKGIANLAAASGSNSQQASTAMYQLSQAIANGKVNLQDWNSVVNAGMGGKLFQEALQKNATLMGENVDQSKSFRDSLQDGWLTTEVLMKTLQEFSEDDSMLEAATKVRTFTQLVDTAKEALGSGWATTWELIFGDFEKSGELWSNVNDVFDKIIGDSADARNALVGKFVDLGGMKNVFAGFVNIFDALSKGISTVKSAFHNIFPPVTAEQLLSISETFKSFTAGLVMTEGVAGKVGTVFEGIFSVFEIGIKIAKDLGGALLNIIPEGVGTGILDLLVMIAEIPIKFNESLNAGNAISTTIASIGEGLKSVIQWIWDALTNVTSLFKGTGDGLGAIGSRIGDVVSRIGSAIGEFMASFGMQDVLNTGFLVVIYTAIKKLGSLEGLLGGVIESFTGILDNAKGGFGIGDLFTSLGESLSAFTGAVKVGSLVAIAAAIGILALSLKLMEGINAEDITKGLAALGTMLVGLTASLAAMSGINMGGASSIKTAIMLGALSVSVLAMAGALTVLSKIDEDDMSRSLGTLVAIIGSLVGAMTFLSSFSGKMLTSGISMIALATAVVIMAQAVKQLAEIDSDSITKAVIALGIIMLELAAFVLIVDGSKLKMSTAISLLAVAGAVKMMVSAIEDIASIHVSDLQKGLVTIGAIMVGMGLLTKLTSGSKMVSSGTGMILMATSIRMMIEPLRELGEMHIQTLVQGLSGLAIVMTEMVLAAQLSKGSLAGSASMVAMAIAIKILVPPLQALGQMNGLEIARALTVLAGGFLIIGTAAYLLAPASVSLLAFAGGLIGVGVAIGLIGIGLLAFTAGLTALSTMTVATVAAIVASVGLLLDGLIDIIPKLVDVAVTLVVALAEGLASGIPDIVNAALVLIFGLLDALNAHTGEIITVAVALVITLAEALGTNIGPLLAAAVKLITDVIVGMADAVRNQGPELIAAIISLVGAILELFVEAFVQIVDAIFGWIPGVSEAVNAMGDAATAGLQERFNGGRVGEQGGADFVAGIDSNTDGARGAGSRLSSSANQGAASEDLTETGSSAGSQYTSGVSNASSTARGAGSNIGNAAKSGASSVSLNTTGRNLGQGLANGISAMWGTVKSAASGLASAAREAVQTVLAMFSPSRALREDGNNFGIGFALGVEDQEKSVASQAGIMAKGAVDAVKSYVDGFMDGLLDALDIQPTITPVLDLSQVNNGLQTIQNGVIPFRTDELLMGSNDARQRFASSVEARDRIFDKEQVSGDTFNLTVSIAEANVLDQTDLEELKSGIIQAVDTGLGRIAKNKAKGWAV